MESINWNLFGNFWKPVPGVEYVVRARNPRTELKKFGNSTKESAVLIFDVMSVADPRTGVGEEFNPTKEFSTGNLSFVDGIKNIINEAQKTGSEEFYFQLRMTKNGDNKAVYSVFPFLQNSVLRQVRRL